MRTFGGAPAGILYPAGTAPAGTLPKSVPSPPLVQPPAVLGEAATTGAVVTLSAAASRRLFRRDEAALGEPSEESTSSRLSRSPSKTRWRTKSIRSGSRCTATR